MLTRRHQTRRSRLTKRANQRKNVMRKHKHIRKDKCSRGGGELFDWYSNKKQETEQAIDVSNAHQAKAMVLTCMDFRFISDTVKFFEQIGLKDNYDEFILAGASLGYSGVPIEKLKEAKYSHKGLTLTAAPRLAQNVIDNRVDQMFFEGDHYWTTAFDDHIKLGKALHSITEIVVIDHMQCGAYKHFYKKLFHDDDKGVFTLSEELSEHKFNIINFIEKIRKNHSLPASGYVLDFNHQPLLMVTNNAKMLFPNSSELFLEEIKVEMFDNLLHGNDVIEDQDLLL